MYDASIPQLLEDLKKPDERVRNQATVELWRIWFHQKGRYGMELLERSQAMFEVGNITQAEALLTELIT